MPDFVRCMRCGRETYAGTPTCPHCGIEVGGNAVIGVDLDYGEISGGGLFLVANGTAVSLVRP